MRRDARRRGGDPPRPPASIPTSRAARTASGSRRPAPTIHSLTFDELQRYDVGRLRPGSEYARRFPHQKPSTARAFRGFRSCFESGTDVRFNIETKISPDAPEETLAPEPFARALIAEIRKAGVAARTTIQSFDFRTLKVVEREAPEIATAYLTEGTELGPGEGARGRRAIWSPDFRDLDAAEAGAGARARPEASWPGR